VAFVEMMPSTRLSFLREVSSQSLGKYSIENLTRTTKTEHIPTLLCTHNMPPALDPPSVGAQALRAPPSRQNVAVLSHAEYILTLTAAAALRVKAALSKAAW